MHSKLRESSATSQRRCRAIAAGFGVLALVLLVYSQSIAQSHLSTVPCFSGPPATFLDPRHPKGYRVIAAAGSGVDTNFLTIRGRNSAHGFEPTFVVHGTLERGGETLVADFSPVGGASALHGHCVGSGDVLWSDGNRWRRGARLSELAATASHLAERAGAAIRASHAELTAKGSGAEGMAARVKAVTDEGVNEPVTAADVAANAVLVDGYRARFPGLAILTEEAWEGGGGSRGQGASSAASSAAGSGSGAAGSAAAAAAAAAAADARLPKSMHVAFDPVLPFDEIFVTVRSDARGGIAAAALRSRPLALALDSLIPRLRSSFAGPARHAVPGTSGPSGGSSGRDQRVHRGPLAVRDHAAVRGAQRRRRIGCGAPALCGARPDRRTAIGQAGGFDGR